MRLGLLADIHEHVEHLRSALDLFEKRRVDQVVSLGDALDLYGSFGRGDEVAATLREVGAVGVWGNHDFGMCHDPPQQVIAGTKPETLEFMMRMQPRLEIEDCLITHVEPWLDPTDVMQLWWYDGPPDTPERAQKSFDATTHRILLIGHLHRWLAMTPEGQVDWDGTGSLELAADQRYLIVIAPVLTGWCAVYDTDSGVIEPLPCG